MSKTFLYSMILLTRKKKEIMREEIQRSENVTLTNHRSTGVKTDKSAAIDQGSLAPLLLRPPKYKGSRNI